MKVIQYIIASLLILYNLIYLIAYKSDVKFEVDSKFNRITLSILLLTFAVDGLISGNVRFRSYDVAKDNSKTIFYSVIALYIAAITFLLYGL